MKKIRFLSYFISFILLFSILAFSQNSKDFIESSFLVAKTSHGGYIIAGITSHGFGGDLWLAKINHELIGVKDGDSNPDDYILYQDYPDPFNPVINISYQIPGRRFVTLKGLCHFRR